MLVEVPAGESAYGGAKFEALVFWQQPLRVDLLRGASVFTCWLKSLRANPRMDSQSLKHWFSATAPAGGSAYGGDGVYVLVVVPAGESAYGGH